MKIKRIEITGEGGSLAIERTGNALRIDSIVRDPSPVQQAWKTWEVAIEISEDDLFAIATVVQQRTDGHCGTNSMVHDYIRELQRFID